MRFSDYTEAVAWLESHVDFERVMRPRRVPPTLQPVVETLAYLADPHRDYATVHVTGTNGKGSTTTLVAALLAETGLRVGLFTSPDLHAVNERIVVNGQYISDEDLIGLLSRLADVEQVTGIVLTRFEVLTVVALLHFSDEGVDVAAIEVGLGGTWDATNVIDSRVAVLTNVDLDHTQVLGPTISDIARDKVGIFRAMGRAIVGTTNAIVVPIARERLADLGGEGWFVGQDFDLVSNDLAVGGRRLTIRTPFAEYRDVALSLHGIHQGANATTAVVAAEALLGRALGDDVVRSALSTARMPGRLEVVGWEPTILVDGAHNPAGVGVLVASLEDGFEVPGRRRCVVGMLRGRDLDEMVEPLVRYGFDEFVCCAPDSPRAVPAAEVAAALWRHGVRAVVEESPAAALALVRASVDAEDLIVVTGSLYVVAEARAAALGLAQHHRA
ncbi:MAG: bifunctional folylpolyglutamate synthase/dihydrofolate synthase [Acidimicrobiales bacterium]